MTPPPPWPARGAAIGDRRPALGLLSPRPEPEAIPHCQRPGRTRKSPHADILQTARRLRLSQTLPSGPRPATHRPRIEPALRTHRPSPSQPTGRDPSGTPIPLGLDTFRPAGTPRANSRQTPRSGPMPSSMALGKSSAAPAHAVFTHRAVDQEPAIQSTRAVPHRRPAQPSAPVAHFLVAFAGMAANSRFVCATEHSSADALETPESQYPAPSTIFAAIHPRHHHGDSLAKIPTAWPQ